MSLDNEILSICVETHPLRGPKREKSSNAR